MTLIEIARDLVDASSSDPFCQGAAPQARNAFHDALPAATDDEASKAYDILITCLAGASTENIDSVAYVAITAGHMVEDRRAPAEALAQVIFEKLPGYIHTGMEFAKECIALEKTLHEKEPLDKDSPNPYITVGHAPMMVNGEFITSRSVAILRQSMPAGLSALRYLNIWACPAVVAFSFDLAAHAKATASPKFMELVELTKDSPGRSIYTVLHIPIKDLLVIFPTEKRAFLMGIFNIDVCFDLCALVSDILITHGLPGERLPPELSAHIKGDANPPADSTVVGQFQFYSLPAAQHDASTLHEAPLQYYAWGEMPVSALHLYQAKHAAAASILIAGPKVVNRGWGGRWSDSGIRCDIFLKKEFTSAEAEEIWTEIQGQAKELTA